MKEINHDPGRSSTHDGSLPNFSSVDDYINANNLTSFNADVLLRAISSSMFWVSVASSSSSLQVQTPGRRGGPRDSFLAVHQEERLQNCAVCRTTNDDHGDGGQQHTSRSKKRLAPSKNLALMKVIKDVLLICGDSFDEPAENTISDDIMDEMDF